ncbi:MAG: heme A synthase [Chthoniobacterales bacterium]
MQHAVGIYHFPRKALHVVAIITTLLTFLLVCSGGLVTSKGVGLSVPDWPTTYGYNMFLFPISRWVGGIFYEHTHRLLASAIGLITFFIGLLTLYFEPRRWVRFLALAAVIAVVIQGLLGGLRVTLYKDEIGIFHAILAQSFFSLLVIFSVVTSPAFISEHWFNDSSAAKLRWLALAGVVLAYFQLIVAAIMRHAHTGLSIPDFPTAYGHFFPNISTSALAAINTDRLTHMMMATTSFQIVLQMIHRGGAILLFGIVVLLLIRSREFLPLKHWAYRWSLYWCLLLLFQITLGAWTIWSNKAADVATAHMALGSIALAGSILFTFRLFSCAEEKEKQGNF